MFAAGALLSHFAALAMFHWVRVYCSGLYILAAPSAGPGYCSGCVLSLYLAGDRFFAKPCKLASVYSMLGCAVLFNSWVSFV